MYWEGEVEIFCVFLEGVGDTFHAAQDGARQHVVVGRDLASVCSSRPRRFAAEGLWLRVGFRFQYSGSRAYDLED